MSGAMSATTLASVAAMTSVAGLGMSTIGAYKQSQAQKQAYEYQSAVARNNAQIAEWQAADALERGARSEQSQRLKAAQLKGAQRARMAANGVALDEGSPLAILQDTDFMNEQDALTIRDNAAREAWGHRVGAANAMSDAGMLGARAGAENPMLSAGSTFLSGAGSVASSWYNRKLTTKG